MDVGFGMSVSRTRYFLADFFMVIVAMIWFSFVFVKVATSNTSHGIYRIDLFLAAMVPGDNGFFKQCVRTYRHPNSCRVLYRMFLFLAAFFTQTIGLLYTTTGKSGFSRPHLYYYRALLASRFYTH